LKKPSIPSVAAEHIVWGVASLCSDPRGWDPGLGAAGPHHVFSESFDCSFQTGAKQAGRCGLRQAHESVPDRDLARPSIFLDFSKGQTLLKVAASTS